MEPQTFIFTGRSGSGKGTQVALLLEYLKKNEQNAQNGSKPRSIYHLETGARFREFVAGKGYSNALAAKVAAEGGRQPDFLAIWMWSHLMVEELKGDEHLIIDGTPRSINEAKALDTALVFYNRSKPKVVHLNVSRDWSEKHLLSRGRSDDRRAEIEKRLNWYEQDVMPAIEYYRTDPTITFVEINGEQPIEKVHKDVVEALFKVTF